MNKDKLKTLGASVADHIGYSDAPLTSADIWRFLSFFLGATSIALIINIAVLMYGPLEFLNSRWCRLVAPLSVVVGMVCAVCIPAMYSRLRR